MLKELIIKKLIGNVIEHMDLVGKVSVDEVLEVIAKVKADPNMPKDKISSAQVLAILKIVCEVAGILSQDVCPLVNSF